MAASSPDPPLRGDARRRHGALGARPGLGPKPGLRTPRSGRVRGRRLSLLPLLLACAPAGAEFHHGGYLKNLYQYTRSTLDHRPYWLDLTRARLELEAGAAPEPLGGLSVKAHAEYDHEVRAGSFFRTMDHRLLGLAEPESYLDMDQTVSTGGSYEWRHRLYRAWVAVESEEWAVRFGRQRVAWGTGKLWNPTDVVNPYQPTAVERDERRGTDALYARWAWGPLGQAEGVWSLARDWDGTDLLARLRGNAAGTDLALMGGKVASSTSSWMLGSDFASDVWGGNLHGELSYTDLRVRTPYWRAVLGYEYTFSSEPPVRWLKDAWVLAELFHNGAGETQEARYDPARLLSGREVALAKDYAGFGFSRDVHPLIKVELYAIVNIDDGSHFLSPSASWNAVKDLHLAAGLQRFGGSARSEYGRIANIAFLSAQYYF